MTSISTVSRRIEETGKLLEHAMYVMVVAVAVVVAACVMVLAVAGTFAALHNGDDFDFGNPAGPAQGDIIVLPAHLF